MTESHQDDHELVRQFQAGNERAFNDLVLRHRKRIHAVATGLLGSADDAEDVAQEVFLKAYSALQEFRGDAQVYTWFYRICVNLCLNRLRQRKVRSFFGLDDLKNTLPDTRQPDDDIENLELSARARRAIAELPDKQRAVFIMRHFDGLPHAEIARIMNRDEGTIKANYFQAVRKLRAKLGPYVEGKD